MTKTFRPHWIAIAIAVLSVGLLPSSSAVAKGATELQASAGQFNVAATLVVPQVPALAPDIAPAVSMFIANTGQNQVAGFALNSPLNTLTKKTESAKTSPTVNQDFECAITNVPCVVTTNQSVTHQSVASVVRT